MKKIWLVILGSLIFTNTLFSHPGELQIGVVNSIGQSVTFEISTENDVYDVNFERTSSYPGGNLQVPIDGDGIGMGNADFFTTSNSNTFQFGYGLYKIQVQGRDEYTYVDYRDCNYPWTITPPAPTTLDIVLAWDDGSKQFSHGGYTVNENSVTRIWVVAGVEGLHDIECFPPFEYMIFTNKRGAADVGGQFLVNGTHLVDSGDDAPMQSGYEVITTLIHTNYNHHDWDESISDNSRSYFPGYIKGSHSTAYYKDVTTITIEADNDIPIEIHDPWYLENPTADPEDWIQLDDFKLLSDITANGDHKVFLYENQYFDEGVNIYRLRAPNFYATSSAVYEFDSWSGDADEVDFGSGSITTYGLETDVVFLEAGACITANYTQVNLTTNKLISIGSGEQLIIPAGAEIPFATGVRIETDGGELIIGDNAGSFVRLYPSSNNWKGIIGTGSASSITLEKVIVEDALNYDESPSGLPDFSIYQEDGDLSITNCVFQDSRTVIGGSDETELKNNLFLNEGEEDVTAILLLTADELRIENNTFVNYLSGVDASDVGLYDHFFMRNNIFYFDDELYNNANTEAFVQVNFQEEAESVLNNNLIYGYDDHGFSGIATSYWDELVFDDPLFIDPANGDYRLQSTSPAINAGDSSSPDDPDFSVADIGYTYYDRSPLIPILTLGVQASHPKLTWTNRTDGNGYADEDISHYTVYKKYYISKFNQTTSYAYNEPGMTYIDYGFGVNPAGPATAYYKVLAIDNIDQQSSWSVTKSTKGYVGMFKNSMVRLPDSYSLSHAYPNPFNPKTTIEYALPLNSNLNIIVFNIKGDLIYQELVVNQQPGYYEFSWDGTNMKNQSVPSGIYIVKMIATGIADREGYIGKNRIEGTQKLMFLK